MIHERGVIGVIDYIYISADTSTGGGLIALGVIVFCGSIFGMLLIIW